MRCLKITVCRLLCMYQDLNIGKLPEGMEGELMSDDPSQQNELMNNFLKQRSAENVAPAPKTDEDKAGEIF